MGRLRRRWTAEEKRRIVEETRAPGSSVSVVARRHDINANLLLLEGPEFVPIGVVERPDAGGSTLLAGLPGMAENERQNGSGEPRRPGGLESRAGVIEIDLANGARVRVDAFVDGRALARVLGALKRSR